MKKPKKSVKKISSKLVPRYIELRGFLSFFILHELSGNNMSGDELAVRIGGRKDTVLTPGTIYPALKRLRRQKLIQCRRRNGRKKIYFLTDTGKREIKALYLMFGDMFYGLKKKIR